MNNYAIAKYNNYTELNLNYHFVFERKVMQYKYMTSI